MASYRPYPPPQQQHPPPPPPQMNPFAPQQAPYGRMPAPPYHGAPPPGPPPGPPPPHQPQFNFGPGAPHQPPPPPQQMYYQPPPPPYSGNNNQPPPPPSAPPPPPSPPPSAPPPPPPAQAPPSQATPPLKEQQPKASLPRVETEEERRARKKREYEKQRVEDRKQQQMLRQTQATILQKTQQVRASQQPQSRHPQPPGGSRASAAGSRPSSVPVERFENRLKKPTTFLCKHKFRNELPDPSAQLKWLPLNKDKDRYTKYRITSLEKNYMPKMIVAEDLGIPLDLLDMSIYNPPAVKPPMAPEDEELLRDDEVLTPIKPKGIRKKERPTDKGVSWLVKTQYISPLSTDAAKTSLTEKQAKERRESRQGRNAFLDNLNDREKQIKAIEESFRAAKSRPVHPTKRGMELDWVMPLLPNFERYEDQFVILNFDGDPTADSEQYNKLDRTVRDECESKAVIKSFSVNGSDPTKQEKFLAYMTPAPHELARDLDDDDVQYSWLREYHWEVRGDDKDNPMTYLVTFDNKEGARYLPLPTKLVLQKKKAKEGRSGDEIEHFPVPSRITVSRMDHGGTMERGESSSMHGNLKRQRSPIDDDDDDDLDEHKHARVEDMDHYSGDEYSE